MDGKGFEIWTGECSVGIMRISLLPPIVGEGWDGGNNPPPESSPARGGGNGSV